MRTLLWLLGCMVVLLGYEGRGPQPGAWTAVWTFAAVLWFFVGCVLGVYALAKFTAAKVGARGVGGAGKLATPTRTPE